MMMTRKNDLASALRQLPLGMLVAWSLVGVVTLQAQEFGAPAMDLVPMQSSDMNAMPAGLEANLKALLDTTRRVRERLNGPAVPVEAERDAASVPRPSFIPPLDPNDSDAPDRVTDLRDRIRLLRRLRSKSTPALSSPKDSRMQSAFTPQFPASIPSAAPSNVSTSQPTLSAIEESLDEKQPIASSVAPQSDVISATQILSTPVDHLSLGESLYQTQNYPAALKSLQAVKADDLSLADRTWLELLIALCHRRLGDTDTAAAQFREISNAKIADRSVPIARWLLKQTELVQNSKPALEAVSVELDTLIERSKTHVQ